MKEPLHNVKISSEKLNYFVNAYGRCSISPIVLAPCPEGNLLFCRGCRINNSLFFENLEIALKALTEALSKLEIGPDCIPPLFRPSDVE